MDDKKRLTQEEAAAKLAQSVAELEERRTHIETNSDSAWNDYSFKVKRAKPKGEIVAEYNYVDLKGNLLFQTVRFEPKDFRQVRLDENNKQVWNINGIRRVPYHLPELVSGDDPVFIVEGEKDVKLLCSKGLTATTNPMGALKWTPDLNQYFINRHVIILPDNDEPGKEHAKRVAQSLQGTTKSIKIVELPGLEYKGDVSDYLQSNTIETMLQVVCDAPESDIARYHIIEPKDVMSYPDPTPLFDGFPLYEMLLNILSGEGGHFKSITALEIITSLVTGKPLFGKYKPVRTGKVILIDEETPYPVMKERITKFGLLETDLLKILHFQNVKMDNESDFRELINVISNFEPILVLFDSLTRLHSKNENASGEMSGVMNNFRKIANTGPSVLTIHHFSKEGGKTRGSTDIVNSVDYEFTNVHSLATNLLTLGIGKCRYIRVEDSILQPRGMRLDYFKTKFENEWDTVGNLLKNLEEPLSVREILAELGDLKISEYNLRAMLKTRVTAGLLETKETEVPYVDKIGRNRTKKVNVYGIKL